MDDPQKYDTKKKKKLDTKVTCCMILFVLYV